MIRNFKCKESAKIFNQIKSTKIPPDIQRIALRKMLMIHAATCIIDLKVPPSNHLKQLKGDRKGYYSIRINKQWRICFKWLEGNAYDLEIIDYH